MFRCLAVASMTETSTRPAAQSKFETRDRIHPDDHSAPNWLNHEGHKALKNLRRHAACRDLGPAIFFPEKGQWAAEAYAVCAGCEVRAACLAFALNTIEREGIWGGTNEVLRRPLLRRVAAGEDPDEVAASYCSAFSSGPVRRTWSDEVKAEALRICAEAGPTVASERTGVPYSTVKSWADSRRQAARRARRGASVRDHKARGDTDNMTDAEVTQLVEQAVQAATTAVVEQLNCSLAETTAELLERLDTLTGVVSASLTVLAPLDPALAEAAHVLGDAASVPGLAPQTPDVGR